MFTIVIMMSIIMKTVRMIFMIIMVVIVTKIIIKDMALTVMAFVTITTLKSAR